MRLLVNVIGAIAIAAIGFIVFRGISRNPMEPRPSNESIQRDLLSAIPMTADHEVSKVDFLDKTVLVAASTTLISSSNAVGNQIADQLANEGWEKASTPLVRTAVYCRKPIVLKVIGPTLLTEARFSYYLEASWGNYFSYCENRDGGS